MRHYPTEHNDRWAGFEHRRGDIVISTRSKCGTTWLQMIVALLVFGDRELPGPLAEISPWLDWEVEPIEVVRARLEAQQHRRIIKTHTPLAGLPLTDGVTYVVAGRRPLDVAVSLYHHARNIDRARFAELTGRPQEVSPREPLATWAWGWLDDDWSSSGRLDSLSGLVHHLADARARRSERNIVLVHFDDLSADLEGQMRRLAGELQIDVPPRGLAGKQPSRLDSSQTSGETSGEAWSDLVDGARFAAMKGRASVSVPDRLGVLADHDAFFRSGRVGEGAHELTAAHVQHCRRRLTELASGELIAWLDRR